MILDNKQYLKYFRYGKSYARLERISPVSLLKHLPVIDPSFVTLTKRSSNEIRETFCEGVKWMCKFFEINAQQHFKKLVIFSISSNYFLIELAQENSYLFCLASFSDLGISGFFPLSYNAKKKFSGKTFKVTPSLHFVL